MLAAGPGESCLAIFSLVYHFSFLSPSLWETARYRLKYFLKGPLSPKQPTKSFNVHVNGFQVYPVHVGVMGPKNVWCFLTEV